MTFRHSMMLAPSMLLLMDVTVASAGTPYFRTRCAIQILREPAINSTTPQRDTPIPSRGPQVPPRTPATTRPTTNRKGPVQNDGIRLATLKNEGRPMRAGAGWWDPATFRPIHTLLPG